MPSAYSEIQYRQGTSEDYGKSEHNPNSIYFLTDTKQIFVGDDEYTTSALIIDHRPTDADKGEEGRLYICTEDGSSYVYINNMWLSIFDPDKVISSIASGECITCEPDPITSEGTVSHGVPEGAEETKADTTVEQIQLGKPFKVKQVDTDKFGHVVGFSDKEYKVPSAEELGTVFKFKGVVPTSTDLPEDNNLVGDVYYVTEDSAEFVWLGDSWEKLGPVVDLSGLIAKQPELSGYVTSFTNDGSLTSAGYTPESGVEAGTYGGSHSNAIVYPKISIDAYGRVTEAQNVPVEFADEDFVANRISYILEQFLP